MSNSGSVITTHNWCEADETMAAEFGYRGTLRRCLSFEIFVFMICLTSHEGILISTGSSTKMT